MLRRGRARVPGPVPGDVPALGGAAGLGAPLPGPDGAGPGCGVAEHPAPGPDRLHRARRARRVVPPARRQRGAAGGPRPARGAQGRPRAGRRRQDPARRGRLPGPLGRPLGGRPQLVGGVPLRRERARQRPTQERRAVDRHRRPRRPAGAIGRADPHRSALARPLRRFAPRRRRRPAGPAREGGWTTRWPASSPAGGQRWPASASCSPCSVRSPRSWPPPAPERGAPSCRSSWPPAPAPWPWPVWWAWSPPASPACSAAPAPGATSSSGWPGPSSSGPRRSAVTSRRSRRRGGSRPSWPREPIWLPPPCGSAAWPYWPTPWPPSPLPPVPRPGGPPPPPSARWRWSPPQS